MKRVTFLGTGTSSGIPTISCDCGICNSDDPKDKRLRTSILIQSERTTIVIDTSPDFRQQMLANGIRKLDAVIYTHHHFDHIGGFDDLRAFNYTSKKPIPIFLMKNTLENLKKTYFYAFDDSKKPGGGVPAFNINFIDKEQFLIGDILLKPVPLKHGNLKVLGFRIDNFAYCTDTNDISDDSLKLLDGLDILVLDALRYSSHDTHYTIEEAISKGKDIGAKTTYFTHMAHEIKHSECESSLPENFYLAYDGLVLNF